MLLDLASPVGESDIRGDTTVMVTSILPFPAMELNGCTPRGFLRVWDGTGIPISDPYPISEHCGEDDPPPEALIRLAATCQKVGIEPPIQVTGRVVNVAIWEEEHWEQVKDSPLGSFLRLRNVKEALIFDGEMNCLTVFIKPNDTTYVTPIPDQCYEVIDLLKQHDKRRGDERNGQSGILPLAEPEIGHVDSSLLFETTLLISNSLQDLLTSYPDGTYTGSVLIKGIIPPLPSISSIDKIVSKADDGAYYYRLGICIETKFNDVAEVIVSNPAGEAIVAMTAQMARQRPSQALANLKSRLEDHITWDCVVRSVMFEGTRMLLLISLAERHP